MRLMGHTYSLPTMVELEMVEEVHLPRARSHEAELALWEVGEVAWELIGLHMEVLEEALKDRSDQGMEW